MSDGLRGSFKFKCNFLLLFCSFFWFLRSLNLFIFTSLFEQRDFFQLRNEMDKKVFSYDDIFPTNDVSWWWWWNFYDGNSWWAIRWQTNNTNKRRRIRNNVIQSSLCLCTSTVCSGCFSSLPRVPFPPQSLIRFLFSCR